MQQDIDGLLQAIYDEYQRPLRIMARGFGVPARDVEDVVQETIISYYQHYPLDWMPSRKKAMLGIIVRNKSIDLFRKNHKEQLIFDSDEFTESMEIAVRFGKDMTEQITREELYRDVDEAFKQLKEDMRIPAKLHMVDEIREKDIAEMLGITQVACRARISRARKILRKLLGPKYRIK